MLYTPRASRGMVVAPHHLAAQAGLAVLREGGNAIEAIVAAAAVTSVVYPQMTGLGGDGFMLVSARGKPPVAIQACGRSGAALDLEFYRRRGLARVPTRGPLAAITVAGTVSAWQAALVLSRRLGGRLKLGRLLEDAIFLAREGYAVTASQALNAAEKCAELAPVPGFARRYLVRGSAPAVGSRMRNPALAESLARLASAGLEDFYRGTLARTIAADLARAGSPLVLADLAGHRASLVAPLAAALKGVTVYNLPPPCQGLASLVILGILDRLGLATADGFEQVHLTVEATKHAFHLRDTEVADPAYMKVDPAKRLAPRALAALATRIDRRRAGPWTLNPAPGDTVWMGAIDGDGLAVSFIHSIYWEFGSGVALRDSGILWQNRGSSFSLTPGSLHELRPRRLPFHTNNPALARFADGRVMVYGAMGGDGQPQTQAAVFTRYARFGQELQQAVSAPRWVLGRTWGRDRTGLRLESRFDAATVAALARAGHKPELIEPYSSVMGHAGALVRTPGGFIEGAADPRSDGAAAGY